MTCNLFTCKNRNKCRGLQENGLYFSCVECHSWDCCEVCENQTVCSQMILHYSPELFRRLALDSIENHFINDTTVAAVNKATFDGKKRPRTIIEGSGLFTL